MTRRLLGIIGLLTTITFFAGFIGLFLIHPQTYSEINNMGLIFFNLSGMEGETWIEVAYVVTGLLNIVFVVGLFKLFKNTPVLIIGKILLLLTGIVWATFGLINYKADTAFEYHLMASRVIITLTGAMVGLLMLGGEFEKMLPDKFSKYYTILSGVLIVVMSMLSLVVYTLDESWIRSNISWTLYFLWFGIIGIRLVQKTSTP